MTLNIRSKIIFISVVVLFAAIGANTFINSLVFTNEYSNALKSNVYIIGEQLRSQLNRLLQLQLGLNDIVGFEEQCQEVIEKYPFIVYVMVIDPKGKILFHNDDFHHGIEITDKIVLDALKVSENITILSEVNGVDVYDSFIPVMINESGHIATIRIGFPVETIKNKTNLFIVYAIAITVFSILLAIILNYFGLKVLVIQPITRLMEIIDQIKSKGSIFDIKIPIDTNDEIGRLSESFNSMAAELVRDKRNREKAEAELAKYKDQLEVLVEERTTQLKAVQKELIENAHKAGMADFAVDTLHNIGNLLNSVRTSARLIKETASFQSIEEFKKANQLIRENKNRLHEFVLNDPKGQVLVDFYLALEEAFESEKKPIVSNIDRLLERVEMIVEVIAAQRKLAEIGGLTDEYLIQEIIEEALNISMVTAERYSIRIIKDLPTLPKIPLQKTKVLYILSSIFTNAKDSMLEVPQENRELTISLEENQHTVVLKIKDTGTGIEKSLINKIFMSGYNAKRGNNGFALHSSANYMSEMKGKIWVESPGEGQGATFFLEFPRKI